VNFWLEIFLVAGKFFGGGEFLSEFFSCCDKIEIEKEKNLGEFL